MGELAIMFAFGDKSFRVGIKAMLTEDADEISQGVTGINEYDIAKDLTAPLVSLKPDTVSM
eukprot:11793457-Ditylum_brightwellii.AAC.1